MQKRIFGNTALSVTVLGYGAMELSKLDQVAATQLLNRVLDEGINFVDTSPCYGVSEQYIGNAISNRRDEYILATKCGCVVGEGGVSHTFDRSTFQKNVDNSLKTLKTDHLDIVQIHAPMPADIPGGQNDDMIVALQEMKQAGKLRHVCITFKNAGQGDPKYPDIYSYECAQFFKDWAVFDVVQLVYGGLTRKCEHVINALAASGKGVIARGCMKNYLPNYADLFDQANLASLLEAGESKNDFLLRYTISQPNLTTAIVGTKNLDHLLANIKAAQRGPLSHNVYLKAQQLLDGVGQTAL